MAGGRLSAEAWQVGAGLGARDFRVWLYQATPGIFHRSCKAGKRLL